MATYNQIVTIQCSTVLEWQTWKDYLQVTTPVYPVSVAWGNQNNKRIQMTWLGTLI